MRILVDENMPSRCARLRVAACDEGVGRCDRPVAAV